MKPIKAVLLFIYCLAALTAVGTSFSHLWRTNKLLVQEKSQVAHLSAS